MKEDILIEQVLQKSPHAFKDLVELYQDRVVNTAFGFTQHYEDAEDIAQEVFIEIYRSIERFKRESSLSTWIYRITVSKSLDFIKSKNRKKRLAHLQSIFNVRNEPIDIRDERQNPADEMEFSERKKVLAAALEKLPENQKIAITLNKFEELSAKEISQVMDISISSVESLIHRAKENLRKNLYTFYKNNA